MFLFSPIKLFHFLELVFQHPGYTEWSAWQFDDKCREIGLNKLADSEVDEKHCGTDATVWMDIVDTTVVEGEVSRLPCYVFCICLLT